MSIAQMAKRDFPEATVSGIGGVETGADAAEFILLGSHTVQVRVARGVARGRTAWVAGHARKESLCTACFDVRVQTFRCLKGSIDAAVCRVCVIQMPPRDALTPPPPPPPGPAHPDGAQRAQVCTGVMIHGYPLVKSLAGGLQGFMAQHGFSSVDQFRGASLPFFTTHTDLMHRQRRAVEEKKKGRVGLVNDADWTGDRFVEDAASMVSNT